MSAPYPPDDAVWHGLSVADTLDRLETDSAGLDSDEARARLDAFGSNEIVATADASPLRLFLS